MARKVCLSLALTGYLVWQIIALVASYDEDRTGLEINRTYMSQVMFSQPMSEVYVVFHKSAICVFEKKTVCFRSKKICFIKWGRKTLFCLFIGKIQQEVTVATTTTTTLHIYYYLPLQLQIYNLLLMALEIAFGVQLSRYNSKKVLLSQTSNTTTTT